MAYNISCPDGVVFTTTSGISSLYDIPTIRAYGTISTSSTAQTIVTYTPLVDGVYEIGSFHEVTAYTSGNVSTEWTYTSPNSVAANHYAWGSDFDGGNDGNHLAANNTLRAMSTLTIAAKSGVAIVAKSFISITATATFYAWIKQIA